jgi:hypothetical protein
MSSDILNLPQVKPDFIYNGTKPPDTLLEPVHYSHLTTQLEALLEDTGFELSDFSLTNVSPIIFPNYQYYKRNKEHKFINPENIAMHPIWYLPKKLTTPRTMFDDKGKKYIENASQVAFRCLFYLYFNGLFDVSTGAVVNLFKMLDIDLEKIENEQEFDSWTMGQKNYKFDQIDLSEIKYDSDTINEFLDSFFSVYEMYCYYRLLEQTKSDIGTNVVKASSVDSAYDNLLKIAIALKTFSPSFIDTPTIDSIFTSNKDDVKKLTTKLLYKIDGELSEYRDAIPAMENVNKQIDKFFSDVDD